ncbi:MAG TPA: transcriptional regulator [Alphaproteobacteria bacterium]|jgi:putative transcriptional regulator
MKRKAIRFDAEALVRSVEAVRDSVTGRRKLALRTAAMELPPRAPPIRAADIARLRARLKVSQPVFAALLNVATVTAVSWEKGRRKPSGAALRLLQIARDHPEILRAA